MYTGKTEQPCCLCGREETGTRLDLPPRAIAAMDNAGPIAWQDVVGEVSIHFCADDWATVRDLVIETGMSPLSRCNAARADLDLREDFEALLNETRSEPDQRPVEEEMRADAVATIDRVERGESVETRALVEARVVLWALEDGPGGDGGDGDHDRGTVDGRS